MFLIRSLLSKSTISVQNATNPTKINPEPSPNPQIVHEVIVNYVPVFRFIFNFLKFNKSESVGVFLRTLRVDSLNGGKQLNVDSRLDTGQWLACLSSSLFVFFSYWNRLGHHQNNSNNATCIPVTMNSRNILLPYCNNFCITTTYDWPAEFLQHNAATCNTRKSTCILQRNLVMRQVARNCCSYYFTWTVVGVFHFASGLNQASCDRQDSMRCPFEVAVWMTVQCPVQCIVRPTHTTGH